MSTQTELVCLRCGKTFLRDAALHRHSVKRGRKGAYCTATCYGDARRDRVELRCDYCGKTFERHARTVRRRKAAGEHQFCSKECAWRSPERRGLMGARRANLKPSPEIPGNDTELAYLAGLLDGEGSFGMSALGTKQINAYMTISNTDMRLLEFCARVTGCGNVIRQKPRKSARHRTQYVWNVGARNELRSILPRVIPFLVGKAEQARTLLEYCERRAHGGPQEARDFELADAIKSLNRRGKPVAA